MYKIENLIKNKDVIVFNDLKGNELTFDFSDNCEIFGEIDLPKNSKQFQSILNLLSEVENKFHISEENLKNYKLSTKNDDLLLKINMSLDLVNNTEQKQLLTKKLSNKIK